MNSKFWVRCIPLGTLTESGSRCCSRKAENSTRRSLVVPMERPCQAGTEGAGADAGSNPGRRSVKFTAGQSPPHGLRPALGQKRPTPAPAVSCGGARLGKGEIPPRVPEAVSWRSTMHAAPRKANVSSCYGLWHEVTQSRQDWLKSGKYQTLLGVSPPPFPRLQTPAL